MDQDVVDLFADAQTTGFAQWVHETYHSVDKAHGRLEYRHSWAIADPTCIASLNAKEKWTGLQSVGMVEAERRVGQQVSKERRYSLLSLPGDARALCQSPAQGPQPTELCGLTAPGTQSASRSRRPNVASKPGETSAGWSEDYLRQVLAASLLVAIALACRGIWQSCLSPQWL